MSRVASELGSTGEHSEQRTQPARVRDERKEGRTGWENIIFIIRSEGRAKVGKEEMNDY